MVNALTIRIFADVFHKHKYNFNLTVTLVDMIMVAAKNLAKTQKGKLPHYLQDLPHHQSHPPEQHILQRHGQPRDRATVLQACCCRAQVFEQPGTTRLPTSHNARQPCWVDHSKSNHHADSTVEPHNSLAQVHPGGTCGNTMALAEDS